MKGFIGNQLIIKLFQDLNKENFSHAYLFTGCEGLGKKTFAKKLSQSLQCKNGKILAPCEQCPTCLQIKKGNHPNTIILEGIDPLSIEMIRKVLHQLNLKSQSNTFKICLIDNAERMTKETANCLLKTLEEPPANSLFILITNKPKLLPETILSRCQKIKFQTVPQEELKKALAAFYPQFNFNEIILSYAAGAPGRAIRFFNDKDSLATFENQKNFFEKFFQGNFTTRLQLNNELSKLATSEISELLETWLFLVKIGLKKAIQNPLNLNKYQKLAKTLLETKQKTAYNLNRRVLLDQLALKSPRLN